MKYKGCFAYGGGEAGSKGICHMGALQGLYRDYTIDIILFYSLLTTSKFDC